MTRRERVIDALNHKDTDIVPYNIDFTWQEKDIVSQYLGDDDFISKIGNHIESCYFDGHLTPVEGREGFVIDDFGVVWNRTGADKDIGVIDSIIMQEPDLSTYIFPKLDEAKIHSEYKTTLDRKDDKFVFGEIGFSMFERAWTLRGMENFLMDLIVEKEFAHKLLDAICDFNMRIIDIALQYDIDGFHFGDDWGQQKGLIMGPALWREFIKPRQKKMYEKVRGAGKFVSQHSCGDIREIFPDLIDIGLNVYQTFQPEIYDIEKVKKEFGSELSFWGGISTQRLLPYAKPDELKIEIRRIMNIMSKDGGYIAAPTHAVPFDVPPENIMAMIEVFQNQ